MGEFKQSSISKGSLRNIQILVNEYPNVIKNKINDVLGLNEEITWVSPLSIESFAEYRDEDFLRKLSLDYLIPDLNQEWTSMGWFS